MEQPKKNDYTSNVYNALKNKVEGFDKTPEQFRAELQNPDYVKNVHRALSEKVEGFDKGYDEFYSLLAPKKKVSSPSSVQGNTSGSDSGSTSSASAGFDIKSISDKKLDFGYQRFNPEVSATKSQLQKNEEVYKEYEKTKIVSEDYKKQIIEEVEADSKNEGLWNNIKKGAGAIINPFFRFLTEWEKPKDGQKRPELISSDPLEVERKEAKKILQEQALAAKAKKEAFVKITPDLITQKAKEIAIEKRIKSKSDSQVRELLETYDDFYPEKQDALISYTELKKKSVSEKDKLLIGKQNITRTELDNSLTRIKDLNAEAVEMKNQKVPLTQEFIEKYEAELQKYNNTINETLQLHEEFISNKKELGTLEDNLDLFKRDYSWASNFIGNLGAASSDIVSGLFGIGDYALGVKEAIIPESWKPFTKAADKPFRDFFKESAGRAKKGGENERNKIQRPINVDDIHNPSDLGDWFFHSLLANQAPIMGLAATGAGGIGVLGASATGQKYEEMLDEMENQNSNSPQYSQTDLIIAPAVFGATETASAMVDKFLMGNASRVLRSATAPERKIISESFAKQFLVSTGKVTKEAIKSGTYEMLDEDLTEISQNITDKYLLNKDIIVGEKLKDVGTMGFVMGAIIPLGAGGIKIATDLAAPFTTDYKIQEASAEVLKLENQLDNTDLSDNTRKIIAEQLTSKKATVEELLKRKVKDIENMPNEHFQEIIRLEKAQANIKNQVKEIQTDENLDADIRKQIIGNLNDEFNANNQRRIDLLERGSEAQLAEMDEKEVSRLKGAAAEQLKDELNPDGTKNITVGDKDISKRAIEIYNKEQILANENKNNSSPTVNPPMETTTEVNETASATNPRINDNVRPGIEVMENNRNAEQKSNPEEEVQNTSDTRTDNEIVEVKPKTYKASPKGKPISITLNDGVLDMRNENGVVPSAPTRKIIMEQYADDFDFTSGELAPEVADQGVDVNLHIAENSKNPAEIAEAIMNISVDNLIENNLNYTDQIIADNIGKIKQKSFERFGDKNIINGTIARNYFNKKGASLDTLAQELSEIGGTPITEQDIIDFIVENPRGPADMKNSMKKDVVNPLKSAFTQLTGLPANDTFLQKAIEKKNFNNNFASTLDLLTDEDLLSLYEERQQFLNYEKENSDQGTEGNDESKDFEDNGRESGVQNSSREEGGGNPSQEPEKIDISQDTGLNSLIDWLDSIDEDLTNFGNDNLSMGIPIVIAKVAIKAMKIAAKTSKNTADIISAGLNAVRESEWFKNLTKAEQNNISNDFQKNFLDLIQDKQNLEDSFEIEKRTPFQKAIDRIVKKFQDKFVNVRNLQKGIEKFTGKKSTEETDFDQAEVLMHGKASEDIQKFDKTVENLAKKIGKAKLDSNTVSNYLMAKHAKERNKHILENVDGNNPAGSGMSDEKADEILAMYSGAEKTKIEDIAKDVYSIIESTRKTYEKFGLENSKSIEGLRSFYEFYVPLKGFAEDELNGDEYLSGGSSLSVQGRENRRAAGRTTKADNVLAQVISQHTNAIIRGRKNEALQKLYNMAKENPNNAIWKIFSEQKPDTKKQFAGNSLRNQPVNMKGNDQYVGVKVDGQQFYIKFENKELGKTLNGATIDKASVLVRILAPFNRFLSMSLTSFDPEFVPTNFTRDIQTAIYNLLSEQDISENSVKGKALLAKTVKNVFPAIRAIYRNEMGKKASNVKLDKYYQEFKEDGAKTGWFYSQDTSKIQNDVDNIINLQNANKLSIAKSKQALNSILNLVENTNTAIENAVRLSTYISAREAGVTRNDAAVLAKELTVNFNKSGEYGKTANAIFLFFNASVQGSARFIKAMTTLKKTVNADGSTKRRLNKAQKIAIGIVIFSGLQALLNQAMSDDDDDGESFYSKIPDYEKERNMIIMKPNGKDYFKIPLPYGYNIFNNIGTMISEVSTGNRTEGSGAGFLANATLGAFSPVNFGQSESFDKSLIKTFTPTALKPVADIAINENFFGSSIYNENLPFTTPKPDSELGRPGSPKAFKNISKFLNEVSGGSEYRSGAIDWNPDNINYIFRFLIGGTGKFVDNTITTAGTTIDKANGKDVDYETNKIPLARRFLGEPNPYLNRLNYLDRRNDVKQIKAEFDNTSQKDRDKPIFKGIVEMSRKLERVDKTLERLKKLEEVANKVKDEKKKERYLKKIDEANTKAISDFNKTYLKYREK